MRNTSEIPALPEALEQWRVHSIRYVAWVLHHGDEARAMGTRSEEYHEEVRTIGQGIIKWDGTGSIIDHIITVAPGEAMHLFQIMEQSPISAGGPELLAQMRRAHAQVEVRQALQTGNIALINAAQDQLKAATEDQVDPWATARTIFPHRSVPWEHLAISESIKQLARAGAVTPAPLPGAVMAILAGIIGRAADVSPKSGWREPLILWQADIRESGDGKTHPARMLIHSLYEWQKNEDERYRKEMQVYEALTKEEKKDADPPAQARSFFATDITLEGLRTALDGHPTGGMTILLDELSSFFSGQNQYKNGKGSDRESWLCLHDGNPARVIRAGKSCYIYGGRVQLYGGIQPAVLRQALTAKNGIFMDDGTIYRFLFTFSRSSFHELTGESWSDDYRNQWVDLLSVARSWADQHAVDPWHMVLVQEAREYFFNWRNELYGIRDSLPQELRGFIPKAVGYALRLTGIIHCLNRFANGQEPYASLRMDDLKAGIAFAEFYLGQAVDAIHYLVGRNQGKPSIDMTDPRVSTLAQVLASIEDQVEGGRVAIGYVRDQYNLLVSDNEGFRSNRAMGAFLRTIGLTVPGTKHNWKNQRNVCCLVFDEKFKTLGKLVCNVCNVCQPMNNKGSGHADIENPMSAMSAIQ